MKLFVTVKPGAKTNTINQIDATHFEIRTKSPARDNKANSAAIEMLAEFFNVPKSKLALVRGAKSKQKVFEVFS